LIRKFVVKLKIDMSANQTITYSINNNCFYMAAIDNKIYPILYFYIF